MVSQFDEHQSQPSQRTILLERVEALRRRFGDERHSSSAGAEGGTTLLLHGEVNFETVPQLEAVLDGLVDLHPMRLTIDLSETTGVSPDALLAIARRERRVDELVVRLPSEIEDQDPDAIEANGKWMR